MKYCMKCGVLIDENKHRNCPLCSTIILKDEEIETLKIEDIFVLPKVKKTNHKVKNNKEIINLHGLGYYIILIIAFIGMFTLFIIDLASGFNITWSKIPLLSILYGFLLVSLPLKSNKKSLFFYATFDSLISCIYFIVLNHFISAEFTWAYYVSLSIILAWVYLSLTLSNKIKGFIIKFSFSFIATAIFVLLITLGFNNQSAFAVLALPINALVFILTIIGYLFIKTYIYNWFIIISTLSINISILCLGIDLLVQKYVNGIVALKWSYIVLIVLIPFTIFMLYLDNRYKVHSYLMKKFHI